MTALPLTIGGIARRARVPVHKVSYMVRSRKIREDGRVGNLRVFGPAKVERIIKELEVR